MAIKIPASPGPSARSANMRAIRRRDSAAETGLRCELHRRGYRFRVDYSVQVEGRSEIGTFGVSVPEEYGGFAAEGEGEYLSMVVATEELSRGSLGVGGSLITRPEILTRALVTGGTEEQKQRWLPRIAAGELMVGVMVTEPDYGSDVAHIKVTATPTEGGYLLSGVKTWATFAGRANVLMLLARTDADRPSGHRGRMPRRHSGRAWRRGRARSRRRPSRSPARDTSA